MNKAYLSVPVMAAVSYLSARGIWLASGGGTVLQVLPFAFAGCIGYLFSHYMVTGKFVDRDPGGDGLGWPDGLMRYVTAAGILLMVSAFPVGITGVGAESFRLLLASQFMFMYGYMIGHYGVTELLL